MRLCWRHPFWINLKQSWLVAYISYQRDLIGLTIIVHLRSHSLPQTPQVRFYSNKDYLSPTVYVLVPLRAHLSYYLVYLRTNLVPMTWHSKVIQTASSLLLKTSVSGNVHDRPQSRRFKIINRTSTCPIEFQKRAVGYLQPNFFAGIILLYGRRAPDLCQSQTTDHRNCPKFSPFSSPVGFWIVVTPELASLFSNPLLIPVLALFSNHLSWFKYLPALHLFFIRIEAHWIHKM